MNPYINEPVPKKQFDETELGDTFKTPVSSKKMVVTQKNACEQDGENSYTLYLEVKQE